MGFLNHQLYRETVCFNFSDTKAGALKRCHAVEVGLVGFGDLLGIEGDRSFRGGNVVVVRNVEKGAKDLVCACVLFLEEKGQLRSNKMVQSLFAFNS